MNSFKNRLLAFTSRRGFRAFVSEVAPRATLLDVGCGNNSPYKVKTQRPDVHYIGLDVGDYNQTTPMLADQYILTGPADFAMAIEKMAGTADAIISSHNIEHCIDPDRVLKAMTAALKSGGLMYISFPSEASATFPSRDGCLNFFDDPTHRTLPRFGHIANCLRAGGCNILVSEPLYRPVLLRVAGALVEPLSRKRGRTMFGTWAYYGFESILWVRKR
jgi:SAM-dependent methyltransferase